MDIALTIWQNIAEFFASDNFMPHGHCFLWKPAILWTFVTTDILIALSYFSIPIAIVFFLYKRRHELSFSYMYVAFAIFILSCGAGHAFDVYALWNPAYGTSAAIRVVTAIASVLTAIAIWPLMPTLLSIPTTKTLMEKNLALEKAQEKYNLLFEESAVGFFEWKDVRDPNAIYWSKRLYELFGVDRENYKPTVEGFLNMIHPDDREQMQYVLKRDFTHEGFKPIEYRLKKNGEYRWFRSHRRVQFQSDGKPKFVVGSVEDIHDAKMTEEKILHINQTLDAEVKKRTLQLQQANEAKSRFLAHMSHEIRTPLGLVLGFSDLLADDPNLAPTSRDYVQLISKNGEILSRVVNDLLDLSKVEAGKLRFSFSHVRLKFLLEEVRAAFEGKAQKKNLQFEFVNAVPSDLILVSDEIRLKQIMYNLLSNAIKFTEGGKVHVACGIVPEDPRFFYFDVVDTGLGVSFEDRDRVFLEFVQGKSAEAIQEYGSGLGLRLSRSLAQALGGDVTLVASQVGKGSHFRLTFSSQDQRAYSIIRNNRPITASDALKGLAVSVLDDNEDNVRLAELFLQKLGCRVKGFTDAEVFLKETLKEQPDLVMLDINMPKMSGYEVHSYLRTHGFVRPIWALTAHALNDDIQKILNSGFNAYILKPINLLSMRQKLIAEFGELQHG